jgi:hypothetical protein
MTSQFGNEREGLHAKTLVLGRKQTDCRFDKPTRRELLAKVGEFHDRREKREPDLSEAQVAPIQQCNCRWQAFAHLRSNDVRGFVVGGKRHEKACNPLLSPLYHAKSGQRPHASG